MRRLWLVVQVVVVGFRCRNMAVVFVSVFMLLMMVLFMVVGFQMVVPIGYNIHRVVRRGKVCRVQSSFCRSKAVEARTMNLAVEPGSSVVSMVTQVSQGDGHQETQHLEYKDDMETSHWLSSTAS